MLSHLALGGLALNPELIRRLLGLRARLQQLALVLATLGALRMTTRNKRGSPEASFRAAALNSTGCLVPSRHKRSRATSPIDPRVRRSGTQ